MNVAELIEKLKKFPSAARVVVDGYEGDFDDVLVVRAQPIIAYGNTLPHPKFGTPSAEDGMGKHIETDLDSSTEVAVAIRRDGTLR